MLEMPSARRVYVFQGEALLVPQAVPDGEIFQGLIPEILPPAPPVEYYEVPSLNGAEPIPYYALGSGVPLPDGWRAVSIRNALPRMSSPDAAAGCTGRLLRAYHIFRWRRESAFCGSCGSPNGDALQGPARRCPAWQDGISPDFPGDHRYRYQPQGPGALGP